MAVNISSFTAWVTIGGAVCPKHQLKLNREGNEATCWIPSQCDKKFSVNWHNSFRDRSIFAQLFIDGVSCSTHFMLDAFNYPADPSCIAISYANTSDFTRRDFVFSPIVVTDDDDYLHTIDSPPAFGTIRLELWEADILSIRRGPFQHTYGGQVLESQVIHEMSKKAGAHHVRFGGEYIVEPMLVNIVNGTRTGSAPLAAFTFNYRPAAMLMAAGIIPRPVAATTTAGRAPLSSLNANVKAESVDDQIQDLESQIAALRAQKYGVSKDLEQKPGSSARGAAGSSQWRADPRTGRVLPVIDLTDL